MNIPVRTSDAAGVEAKLRKVNGEIRLRAYELYCRRAASKGTALADWQCAERERSEAPLAGITESENDIRITACVPHAHLKVALDALPDEIVVEGEGLRNGEVRRYTRLTLPVRIDTATVTARLNGTELDILAHKERLTSHAAE